MSTEDEINTDNNSTEVPSESERETHTDSSTENEAGAVDDATQAEQDRRQQRRDRAQSYYYRMKEARTPEEHERYMAMRRENAAKPENREKKRVREKKRYAERVAAKKKRESE